MLNNASDVTNPKTTDVKGTQVILPCQLVVTVCREMAGEFSSDIPSTSAECCSNQCPSAKRFRKIAKPEDRSDDKGAEVACQRTSATILAQNGGDILSPKRHGGWRSLRVAEGYIQETIADTNRIAGLVQGVRPSPSASTSITITSATAIDDNNLFIPSTSISPKPPISSAAFPENFSSSVAPIQNTALNIPVGNPADNAAAATSASLNTGTAGINMTCHNCTINYCFSASPSSSQESAVSKHKTSSNSSSPELTFSSPKPKRLKLDKTVLPRILTISVFTISTFEIMKSLEHLNLNHDLENYEDDQSDFARYRRQVLNRVYVVNNIFREGFMPSREGFLPSRPQNPAQREGLVAVSRPANYRRFYDNFFRPRFPGSRRYRRVSDLSGFDRSNIPPAASDREDVRFPIVRNRQRMSLDGANIEYQANRVRRKQMESQGKLQNAKVRPVRVVKRKRCELEDLCDEDSLSGNHPGTSSSSASSSEDSEPKITMSVGRTQAVEDQSEQPHFISVASTSSDFSPQNLDNHQFIKSSPSEEKNVLSIVLATSAGNLHTSDIEVDGELKTKGNLDEEAITSDGRTNRALKRFQDACDYYVTAISLKKRKLDDEADEFSKKQANTVWSSFPYFIAPTYVPRKNISKFSLESTNVHEDLSIQRYGDPPLFSWS